MTELLFVFVPGNVQGFSLFDVTCIMQELFTFSVHVQFAFSVLRDCTIFAFVVCALFPSVLLA